MHKQETIIIDSLNDYEKLDNGFIRIPAKVTRSGIFLYKLADGRVIRENRSKDEVFSEDSLKTIMGVTITNDHPTNNRQVNANNFKELAVGFVGDSVQVVDDKYVMVPLTITDADTIRDIENGKRELSCGYNAVVVNDSGINEDGEEYDTRQTEIRYNHVAIVTKGRAGSSVRIDDQEAVLVEAENTPKTKQQKGEKQKMSDQKNDTDMINTLAELKAEVKDRENQIEALNLKLQKSDSHNQTISQELDEIKEQLKEANTHLDSFDKRVNEYAKERANLIKATESLVKADELDGLCNSDLKVKFIQSKTDSFDVDGKTADQIGIAFDAIRSIKEVKADSIGSDILSKKVVTMSDKEKAYKESYKNAWKENK
jgi:uncharacterized protein